MAESGRPCFLFIPASGPAGSGEYMRCLLLARSFQRRWPQAQLHFVVNGRASYARSVPFPALQLESSPAHANAAVNAHIALLGPDVVIFDNTGRASQLRGAKAAGAACVFVSSRPRARRKGLRLSRIRWLDQHWVAQPHWATPPATLWERLKKRLVARVETLHLDAVFEDSDADRRASLRQELGLEQRRYLVFCAGGGGNFGRGPRAPDVLLEAAAAIADRTDYLCVVVLGPNYERAVETTSGVVAVRQLDNPRLMNLLHDAELVITSGGDVLMQALTLGKPCVAFPVAGDQPARIARCLEQGLIQAAALSSEDIIRKVSGLLADHASQRAMLQRLSALHMRNGLHTAIAALERLLTERARRRVGS